MLLLINKETPPARGDIHDIYIIIIFYYIFYSEFIYLFNFNIIYLSNVIFNSITFYITNENVYYILIILYQKIKINSVKKEYEI